MGIRNFPRISGPPPASWGSLFLIASFAALFFLPRLPSILTINLIGVAVVLGSVVKGARYMTRADRSFLLISVLLILIVTYGLARGVEKIDFLWLLVFEALPALILYAALRIYAFRFAWTRAMKYADTLGAEDRVIFADQCRTRFKRRLGALQAGAEIYRSVAEEGLAQGGTFKPIHILAMQKYAHMLLYGEARGMAGEGEWYAKKAHELSLQLLKKSDIPATLH